MNPGKPEFVIFYAWQSDRPASKNRYLIQEAAAEAAARISQETDCPYHISIDQGTQEEPGLCDIPATILKKINAADAFLCDLTYVATSEPSDDDADDEFKPRYCSNPNVLFELGYAFHTMGSERLLCVMNEKYGPVAEQMFDLAHRRFPISYRLPEKGVSRAQAKASLAGHLEAAIRMLLPLGRRIEAGGIDRVSQIRDDFEAEVRNGGFYGLVRRRGAIAMSLIPSAPMRLNHQEIKQLEVHPPTPGGHFETRGNAALGIGTKGDDRCSIAAMRNDGVLLAADTWLLDPSYHRDKSEIVTGLRIESIVLTSMARYLAALQKLNAPLPWYVSVSLLEVQNYWFVVSSSENSRAPFSEPDIRPEPLVIQRLDRFDHPGTTAKLLRPIIDFVWREFGYEGSFNYSATGEYTARLLH